MSKDDLKHGFIDQGKYKERSSKIKWTYREYHFRVMLMFHTKTWKYIVIPTNYLHYRFVIHIQSLMDQGGVGKHYHLRFDTNLGHGICVICRIPCACVVCTSMLDKPWISGIQSTKQERYQPVINCTYWKFLGPYKNWTTIELTPKSIPFEDFDEMP